MRGHIGEEVLSAHLHRLMLAGGPLTDKSFEERRQELRDRVRDKLQNPDQEFETPTNEAVENIEDFLVKPMIDLDYDEKSKLRLTAAILILIGSILGVISGGMLLQGNPEDLINSSIFKDAESVDLTGNVLDTEGVALNNTSVELIEYESGEVLQTTSTNERGYFQFDNVKPEKSILRLTKDGYFGNERIFIAEDGLMNPFTMEEGNSTIYKTFDETTDEGGWSLENAVALSTFVSLITIGSGFLGIQASIEARRAKKYRRTQYFAGFSLFSRGLILIGPLLILIGMALLSLAKTQFEDQLGDQ